ncbi:hypothetical protein [Ktedonobacter racemifer]|uniref:hypothetical protein n=1 Tax=Ktedonobacter racemifer TaxID=363277 RepID=UPI0012F989A2|nr:hypothetical protein [Ktedonobacter racemifer]
MTEAQQISVTVTTTLAQAWERVEWYKHHWVVEECLKTGCCLEERQLQRAERIIRLLGLLSPAAVRLLQLRDLSRQEPQTPASEGGKPMCSPWSRRKRVSRPHR